MRNELELLWLLLLSRYAVEVGGTGVEDIRKEWGDWVLDTLGRGRLWWWVG